MEYYEINCRLNNTAVAELAVKLNHLRNNRTIFLTLALCITNVHIPPFLLGTLLVQALFW